MTDTAVLLHHGAHRLERRDDAPMRTFRRHRLGQFVHFGLYSLPAGIWNGVEYRGAAEFLKVGAQVDDADWAALTDRFRLERFDASEWADAAKRSGAGYVTITTKHHEGFCLWPSALTDFHIGRTPFGRDLLGELVEAYQAVGLDVHLYYSVLDWHHPGWRYRITSEADAEAFDTLLAYSLGQLEELVLRYPGIKGFWFDGTWDDSVRGSGAWTDLVEQRLKELSPDVLVNSRLRADELGNRHFDAHGRMMGDFESGFERRLPDPWDASVLDRNWEACLTINEHTWGYHAGDWARTEKDPRDVVAHVAHAVSRGGNVLLNIGPRGDGSLDPRQTAVTDAVGAWLERHGEAVRGCGPALELRYPGWGFWTAPSDEAAAEREDVRYAIVTAIPTSGRLMLQAPAGYRFDDVAPLTDDVTVGVREVAPGVTWVDPSTRPEAPFVLRARLCPTDHATSRDVNPDVVD